MTWENERILILVKAAPNWSNRAKEYLICTAGVNANGEWRRLYPFPEDVMLKKNVRVWDTIEAETTRATHDIRQESREIKADSIQILGHLEDRNERRKFLEKIAEPSLDIALKNKRSMALIKPRIEKFNILKKIPEIAQVTLNGGVFKRSPYSDVGLYYKWRCPTCCQFCDERPHTMQCLDWGANILYKRYKDEKEARAKVKKLCFYGMKYDYDTWFALGTHSRRPFKRWMVVGLLWMKKEVSSINT